jgi:S1-C subfamily serine protease
MTRARWSAILRLWAIPLCLVAVGSRILGQEQEREADELAAVRQFEQARAAAIQQVIGSVIAIYGDDREGGGSGVIIDPCGLALTNHHVIQAAGIEGWGGLADGQLYRWSIVGTDPGGDIALIQMRGRDSFPFAPLGDSDQVRVGDWAMAMGNPFVLSEDETPTVTLGIVSGVNRFQEGAGSNQLVYGNCIQVDSSINPGNSGGPLFNLRGEVIGINGRGSFEERGRVNVGLGYAISANQIKNFIPDLLATKIVEHGTLDANFELRDGQVVCGSLVEESAVHRAGLELGDRLIRFEDQPIRTVNQYLNLICTLPAGWPAKLELEKADGTRRFIHIALYGLPYNIDSPQVQPPPDEQPPPTPEMKRALERQKKMIAFLSTRPSSIRDAQLNARNFAWLTRQWQADLGRSVDPARVTHLIDAIQSDDRPAGRQEIWFAGDGRFLVRWELEGQRQTWGFDGSDFWHASGPDARRLSLIEAKTTPQIAQVLALAAPFQATPLAAMGVGSLDGGDKAQGRLACRLRFTDAKQDWFYCWLSLYGNDGRFESRPLKASSELSADRGIAVTFADWDNRNGLIVPATRQFVTGFDEQVRATLRLESCETLTEIAKNFFQMPPPETFDR